MTERNSKTVVAYLLSVAIVSATLAGMAAFVRWPDAVLVGIGVVVCLYLFHVLTQAVRASLP